MSEAIDITSNGRSTAIVDRFGETSLDVIEKAGFLVAQCAACIEVSHPYGPAPLAGRRALQEPRGATGVYVTLHRIKNLRGEYPS